MRILVSGRHGQVARSLAERASVIPGIELIVTGRPDFDLLDPNSVRSTILACEPDIVVSAAAYTSVDQAEDEPDTVQAINVLGARAVSAAAAEIGAPVIHLSTDYVFGGKKAGAYVETDTTGPTGVYGRTKLDGEAAVAAANGRHVILRTAWVHSPFGRNFVKTMLTLAKDQKTVRVVSDQFGNPTSALDIADGILHIAKAVEREENPAHFGTFHLASAGGTNWSGLAREIFAESRRVGGPWANVEDLFTDQYPTRAKRPASSLLNCQKLWDTYRWRAPGWRESCRTVVRRLVD
ncbi:dTDP-4-dehydrorhamnose reductase [Mesorhizobium sp. M1380]|uniref:dTDP-4-dehydrorhamnose reductase n=1 Tax=Mesorhizobium sp. M1380 TaxID=2957093 RepID=UPI003339FF53